MTTPEIPEAAVKAVADALHGDACPVDPDTGESCGCGDYEREAEIALKAAMPHIREHIAQEVEAEAPPPGRIQTAARGGGELTVGVIAGITVGLTEAARIIREGDA